MVQYLLAIDRNVVYYIKYPSSRNRDVFMARPIVTAIVVCDNVYRDTATQKCVLSGTFTTINGVAFPARHGHAAIYVALTDISECGIVQVVFRTDPEHNVVAALPGWKIEKIPEDRTETIEICGNIAGLPLPSEGRYEFAVFWNDSFIGSKRISVRKMEIK